MSLPFQIGIHPAACCIPHDSILLPVGISKCGVCSVVFTLCFFLYGIHPAPRSPNRRVGLCKEAYAMPVTASAMHRGGGYALRQRWQAESHRFRQCRCCFDSIFTHPRFPHSISFVHVLTHCVLVVCFRPCFANVRLYSYFRLRRCGLCGTPHPAGRVMTAGSCVCSSSVVLDTRQAVRGMALSLTGPARVRTALRQLWFVRVSV